MNENSALPLSDHWLNRLQASGYRLTHPLQIIVEILANATRALEPLQIYDLGRQSYPKMGLVTVYRALEKMEELGLIQRVHQADGCHAYLRAANGHEHLLFCRNCGKAVFFSGDDISSLIDRVTSQSGFVIEDHWLQLVGVCADCR